MTEEPQYRGRYLSDLQVIDITWSDWSADHMQTRTSRYPDDPDELDIEPEWASEAALDEHRQLSITKENDLRVLGLSPNAPSAAWSRHPGRVLRIVLKPIDIDDGYWSGVTAMPASASAAGYYWRHRGNFGPT